MQCKRCVAKFHHALLCSHIQEPEHEGSTSVATLCKWHHPVSTYAPEVHICFCVPHIAILSRACVAHVGSATSENNPL